MLNLIARLEGATELSRELNWLIAEELGEIPAHSVRAVGFDYDWYRRPNEFSLWKANDSEGRDMSLWQPKEYTFSVDSALKLIPEGWMIDQLGEWQAPLLRARGAWYCIIVPREEKGPHSCWRTRCNNAHTPALATCIAALRARVAVTNKET